MYLSVATLASILITYFINSIIGFRKPRLSGALRGLCESQGPIGF
jgi:hypothetical protein